MKDAVQVEALTTGPSAPPDLSTRVALVTGGARGIGRATAEALAAAGAAVTVMDLNPTETVVAAIQENGGRAIGIEGNITRRQDVARAIAQTLEAFGRLDILVNNAGTGDRVGLAELDLTFLAQQMDANVNGMVLCTQAALEVMKKQGGGKVVNISSVSAKVGGVVSRDPASGQGRSGPAYAMTKGAILSFTRWVAVDAGRYGITVNAVCPGPVRTPAIEGGDYDLSRYAIARMGETADIAQAVLFFASPMSNWVTGQSLNVDGGLRMD